MSDLGISVIVPTFNRARMLGRAVRSVLDQLSPLDELLVVDDGSTDNTAELIASMAHPLMRYLRQTRGGAGAARNRGIAEARGQLVAFVDSDDEYLPGKLELQRRLMQARPDVLFCFTDFLHDCGGTRHAVAHRTCWHTDPRSWDQIMGPAVQYSSVAVLPPDVADFPVHFGDIYLGEMKTNYLSANALVARRVESGDALRFNPQVPTYEDWECFGRLAGRGRAAFLDRVCAVQNRHSGPRVTDADWVQRAEARLQVLANVWGADAQFLERHGEEYATLVHEQHLARLRGLIVLGRPREARLEMSSLDSVPLLYRAGAACPAPLMRAAVRVRHAWHDWRHPDTGSSAC